MPVSLLFFCPGKGGGFQKSDVFVAVPVTPRFPVSESSTAPIGNDENDSPSAFPNDNEAVLVPANGLRLIVGNPGSDDSRRELPTAKSPKSFPIALFLLPAVNVDVDADVDPPIGGNVFVSLPHTPPPNETVDSIAGLRTAVVENAEPA